MMTSLLDEVTYIIVLLRYGVLIFDNSISHSNSVGFWNVKICLSHTICMYSCKLLIKKPQGKYILSIEKLVFMWLECFFKFLSQHETHVSYFVYLLIWYVPASLQFQNTITISIKIDFYRIVNSLSSCDIVSTLFSCFLFQGSQKLPWISKIKLQVLFIWEACVQYAFNSVVSQFMIMSC